ncbi:MAG: Ig-like domain-containing protein, partial [Candidatus Thiodiazotropha sp.]
TFSYGSADTVTRSVGGTSFVIDFDGSGFNVMPDGPGWMPEADLQTLLRGVTYENISQDPTAGDRTVNIFVQDSSLLTGPIATSTITVNPQNDSPTATDNTNSVSESGFVSGNVITDDSGSGVDSDPEGDGLQVTQVEGGAYTPGLPVTLASGAQVTFQPNGSYTYNTNGQFDGLGAGSSVDDSFTYQISDGNGGFATATVTITINGSNNAPVITSAGLTLDEGQTVTLSDTDFAITDADDTAFTYTVTGVTGGYFQLSTNPGVSITNFTSVNLTGGLVQFVDDGNEVAPAFSVTANDGDTDSNTLAATINFTLVSDSTPIANADSIAVAEGGTASTLVGGSSTVLNNDTGLGDTPVTVSLVTDVTNGTLTLNGDGTFSYTHDGSENFTDSFTYRITDNDGETADATVIIDIVSTNSSPEASDTDFSVLEDTVYTGNLPTASDGDGDTVIYQLENGPAYGSATVDANGRFSYTPDSDYHGADSFNYSVSDGNGGYNSYLVEIDVVAANDSPVITSHGENENVFLALEENTVIVTTVVADDPDNDDVSFAIDGGTDLGLFSIDPASGELVFINAPDTENPLDSDQDNLYQVQVLVADGNGGTDRQTFTIEVTDVDEFDVGLLIDTEETPDTISQSDSLHDGIGITVWAEDPDSSNNQITYSLDDDSNGLFSIDPSSGVVALASAVENRDASQFEITVRATSADGSYSLKSFIISLNNLIELLPEPEEPYLDDIIYELGPVEPDSPVSAHPEETMAHSTVPTAVDGVTESIQTREVSDALIQSVEEYPTQGVTETGRDAIDRFDKSLFSTEGRSSHSLGFMQMRFTPAPVSPDELPL